jgi:hypothetical protein
LSAIARGFFHPDVDADRVQAGRGGPGHHNVDHLDLAGVLSDGIILFLSHGNIAVFRFIAPMTIGFLAFAAQKAYRLSIHNTITAGDPDRQCHCDLSVVQVALDLPGSARSWVGL